MSRGMFVRIRLRRPSKGDPWKVSMSGSWPDQIPPPQWALENPSDLLTNLSTRHRELMQAYVFTLSQSSKLRTFFGNRGELPNDGNADIPKRELVASVSQGFLVRLFVEGHVRSKAEEFRGIYLQMLTSLPAGEDHQNVGTWLEESAAQWGQLRDSISDRLYFLRLLLTLSPIAFGFLAARLGQSDIYAALFAMDLKAYRTASVWLFVPASYLLTLVVYSFRFKRSIFYPRYLFADQPSAKGQAEELSARNVYSIEDELCTILQRRKSREIQWDFHSAWIADLLLLAATTLLFLRPYGRLLGSIMFVIFGVLPILVTSDWVVLPRRRTYR